MEQHPDRDALLRELHHLRRAVEALSEDIKAIRRDIDDRFAAKASLLANFHERIAVLESALAALQETP